MNRSTFSLGSVFKTLCLLICLTQIAQAGTSVKVNDFLPSGTTDIIIAPTEMTRLLWRDASESAKFDIYFGDSDWPNDSFNFVVNGSYKLSEDNFFNLDWTVAWTCASYKQQFSFEGEGLDNARQALFASLDSLVVPVVTLRTFPDSASLLIDSSYKGTSPLLLDNIPVGWHKLEARTKDGALLQDSFHLTKDTTVFNFVLKSETKEEFAYLHLLSPPECDVYINGAHREAPHNNVYRLQPGEVKIRLVSPQYGTRELEFSIPAGDTVPVSFFKRSP